MGSKTPLGNLVHPLTADLYLYPLAIGTHKSGVQGLVTVGLGHSHPVAQPVGLGLVQIGNERVNTPGLGLLRNGLLGLTYNAKRQQIIDLDEGTIPFLHLVSTSE